MQKEDHGPTSGTAITNNTKNILCYCAAAFTDTKSVITFLSSFCTVSTLYLCSFSCDQYTNILYLQTDPQQMCLSLISRK